MKKLSQEEINLTREAFISAAKITRDFRYKELTVNEARKYIEAYQGRYKAVPCIDTLIEILERDYFNNLSMGCYSLLSGDVKNKYRSSNTITFQKAYEKIKEVKMYGSWKEFFNHSMENELMVNCGYLSFFIRMMNLVLKLYEQENLKDNDVFWDYLIEETNSCAADCRYATNKDIMTHYVVAFIGFFEKEEYKERAEAGDEFYQKLLQKESA